MLIVEKDRSESIELDKLFGRSNNADRFVGIVAAENKTTATIYRLYAATNAEGVGTLMFSPVVGLKSSPSNDNPGPYRAWYKERTENMRDFVSQALCDDRLQLHYFRTEMDFANFLVRKIKGTK